MRNEDVSHTASRQARRASAEAARARVRAKRQQDATDELVRASAHLISEGKESLRSPAPTPRATGSE